MLAAPMLLALLQTSALLPGGLDQPLAWIALALLVVATVAAIGVWALVSHVRALRGDAARLTLLEELDQKVGRLVAERDDLDLRRIEHVLIDLRDAQARLEEQLVRVVERGGVREVQPGTALASVPDGESIAERVTNRLLALGYERVQLVTRTAELAAALRDDGEVLVEAKKDGVLHKGRLVLQGGRIADVDLNPAYSVFP